MKKQITIIAILSIAIIALTVGGIAYAQAQDPDTTPQPFDGSWMGRGRMQTGSGDFVHPMWNENGTGMPMSRGRGGGVGPGMMYQDGTDGYGVLHEYMLPAMANALDLTPEEYLGQHENGETFWSLGTAKGWGEELILEKMTQARTEALNKAVADQVITQEQADWMLERMNYMGQGSGFGSCHGDGAGSFTPETRGRGGRWG